MDWERDHSGGEITSTEPAKFFGGCCNGGYFVPKQLATDLIDVTNILRDHLFITGAPVCPWVYLHYRRE